MRAGAAGGKQRREGDRAGRERHRRSGLGFPNRIVCGGRREQARHKQRAAEATRPRGQVENPGSPDSARQRSVGSWNRRASVRCGPRAPEKRNREYTCQSAPGTSTAARSAKSKPQFSQNWPKIKLARLLAPTFACEHPLDACRSVKRTFDTARCGRSQRVLEL